MGSQRGAGQHCRHGVRVGGRRVWKRALQHPTVRATGDSAYGNAPQHPTVRTGGRRVWKRALQHPTVRTAGDGAYGNAPQHPTVRTAGDSAYGNAPQHPTVRTAGDGAYGNAPYIRRRVEHADYRRRASRWSRHPAHRVRLARGRYPTDRRAIQDRTALRLSACSLSGRKSRSRP